MIAGVVEHDDHAAPARAVTQQLAEKSLKGLDVEHLAHATDELAGTQVDRAEAGYGLARRRVQQNGVLDLHVGTYVRAHLSASGHMLDD